MTSLTEAEIVLGKNSEIDLKVKGGSAVLEAVNITTINQANAITSTTVQGSSSGSGPAHSTTISSSLNKTYTLNMNVNGPTQNTVEDALDAAVGQVLEAIIYPQGKVNGKPQHAFDGALTDWNTAAGVNDIFTLSVTVAVNTVVTRSDYSAP